MAPSRTQAAAITDPARPGVLGWSSRLRLGTVLACALGLLLSSVLLTAPVANGLSPTSGDRLWMYLLDGAGHGYDAITNVAAARDGSLYAAGIANDDGAGGADILLVKNTPSGLNNGWTLEWDSPTADADQAVDLAVDGAGNVIVVGSSFSVAKRQCWIVMKYSPARDLLWRKYWGSSDADVPVAAVMDAAGSVCVCGAADASTAGSTWKVVKFRAGNGSVAWSYTYRGPGADTSADTPLAMDIDASGNLYVSGCSRSKAGDRDIVVVRISPKGKRIWTRRIDGPSHLDDEGVALVAIPKGGAYVAAHSWTGVTRSRLLLVRISAAGRCTWPGKWKRWNDAKVLGRTSVEGIDMDAAGNVYVAGYSRNPLTTDSRAFVQKRAPNGRLRWVRYHRPPGIERSAYYALVASSAGRVWVGGSALTSTGRGEWLVARYETDGRRVWTAGDSSPATRAGRVTAITLAGTKTLFVGGVVETTASIDAAMAKYLR